MRRMDESNKLLVKGLVDIPFNKRKILPHINEVAIRISPKKKHLPRIKSVDIINKNKDYQSEKTNYTKKNKIIQKTPLTQRNVIKNDLEIYDENIHKSKDNSLEIEEEKNNFNNVSVSN